MLDRFVIPVLVALLALPASAAPVPDAGPLAERDSPIVANLLESPVPQEPDRQLAIWALLSELKYEDEARRFLSFIERSTLRGILGEPAAPTASVADVLKQEAKGNDDRSELRALVLSKLLSVEFPDVAGSALKPAGFEDGGSYTRRVGRVWSQGGAKAGPLYVPAYAKNISRGPFLQIRVEFRLVPVAAGPVVKLAAERTGGTATSPGASLWLVATTAPESRGLTAEQIDAALNGLRDGSYRLEADVREVSIRPAGAPHFIVRSDMARFDGGPIQQSLVADAARQVAAASCVEKGNCLKPGSGSGLFSPYAWMFAQIVLGFSAYFFFPRWKTTSVLPRRLYGVYLWLVVGTAILAWLDPPGGRQGQSNGIFSAGAEMLLGLPWVLFFFPALQRTSQLLFSVADASVIAAWLAMGINQILLGYLAFRPQANQGER